MSERILKVGLVQQTVADNNKATNWNRDVKWFETAEN